MLAIGCRQSANKRLNRLFIHACARNDRACETVLSSVFTRSHMKMNKIWRQKTFVRSLCEETLFEINLFIFYARIYDNDRVACASSLRVYIYLFTFICEVCTRRNYHGYIIKYRSFTHMLFSVECNLNAIGRSVIVIFCCCVSCVR